MQAYQQPVIVQLENLQVVPLQNLVVQYPQDQQLFLQELSFMDDFKKDMQKAGHSLEDGAKHIANATKEEYHKAENYVESGEAKKEMHKLDDDVKKDTKTFKEKMKHMWNDKIMHKNSTKNSTSSVHKKGGNTLVVGATIAATLAINTYLV